MISASDHLFLPFNKMLKFCGPELTEENLAHQLAQQSNNDHRLNKNMVVKTGHNSLLRTKCDGLEVGYQDATKMNQ